MNRKFAELTGMVTPAGHRSEREADRAARQAVREAGRGPVRTRAHGGRLDDDTRQRMERAIGAGLSAERVHTSRDVDEVSDLLQAHATAIDGDVYLRRAGYRPGTRAGDELLAHAVQRAPADQISLKRRKIHLDFVRMKRAKIQFGRIIRKKLGLLVPAQGPEHGTWGHFWTEVGKLDRVNPKQPRWQPEASYGWWPSGGVAGPVGALRGVQGEPNQGQQNDPHHGHAAPAEFHPVMDVDNGADYAQVRQQAMQQIHQFAASFKGSWNWRLGWGKNCQTFQRALKKKVGLHYAKSKYWLDEPGQPTMGEISWSGTCYTSTRSCRTGRERWRSWTRPARSARRTSRHATDGRMGQKTSARSSGSARGSGSGSARRTSRRSSADRTRPPSPERASPQTSSAAARLSPTACEPGTGA
jgi:hypothetical protein